MELFNENIPLGKRVQENIDLSALIGCQTLLNINQDAYTQVLFNLYYIVKDSVPLMKKALNILLNSKLSNIEKLYLEYLKVHIKEELNHDIWLLQDIKEILKYKKIQSKFSLDENIRKLIAIQWYFLHNNNVWPLLGHMWSLESRPPNKKLIMTLRKQLQLTPNMTRTYDRHAEDDIEHAQSLGDMLLLIGKDKDNNLLEITSGANATALGVLKFWLNTITIPDIKKTYQ